MLPNQFITAVSPGAQTGQKQHGILASLSIAQAILESGWGVHTYGANNLFGIKANGWTGKTVTIRTAEEDAKGNRYYINAAFRAYDSWADSIADHAAFLRSNNRYANLIGNTNYKAVCALIQADGYATEHDYATQLIALIENYKLNQYDILPPLTTIDIPKGTVSGDFTVGGWAVNAKGIKRIDIYADGTRGLGNVMKLSNRPDVTKLYSLYSGNNGFNFTVKKGTLKAGRHAINVAAIGNDNSVKWATTTITVK